MIRLFLISLMLTSQAFMTSAHEYYVSLTEVTYKPEDQKVEIISRLFHDDFERVLKARYNEGIEFKPSVQSEDIDAFIKLYFDEKFKLSIDNKTSAVEYLGYKFEQDRVNIYLKVENSKTFNSVGIENLLLTDLIEEQKNIVHFFKPNQKKSVLLTRFNSEAMLKFN